MILHKNLKQFLTDGVIFYVRKRNSYFYRLYLNKYLRMQLAETENHQINTNESVGLDVVWDECKLTVTLMDFVDGVIYSRQYTNDDIGGEINTEMNLADLFKSLSHITTNCETEVGQLKDDEFG